MYFCELAFSRLRGFNILFAEEKYVNMCQLHIHIEKLRPMLITFSFSNYVFFSDLWFCFQSDVPPLLDRCDLGTILPNHVDTGSIFSIFDFSSRVERTISVDR